MRGARARLFVAVDPPTQVREELGGWARSATGARGSGWDAADPPADLRLLAPELLHLTLCFLGSRPVGEIGVLAEAVQACAEHWLELSLGAPLWLPARAPRALAIAVSDASGELGRLHEEVVAALVQASSWTPERRRFRAHITVARVRGRPRGARAAHADGGLLPPTPQIMFVPESISLYRSRLGPSGADYEALSSAALVRCA